MEKWLGYMLLAMAGNAMPQEGLSDLPRLKSFPAQRVSSDNRYV